MVPRQRFGVSQTHYITSMLFSVDENRIDRGDASVRDGLSPREHQLLSLAAQGFTDNAIAHKLGISLATVGTYWGRIRIKFGPLNRTELVAIYLREEAAIAVEELKLDNERLLHEVEQHSQAEEVLRANLDLFRSLVETAPDAIILVNEEGVIELANEAAEEMFGYKREELVGLAIEKLVPEDKRFEHVHNRQNYYHDPIKRKMGEHLATDALRKDGSIFRMATALSATKTDRGLLVTCIVRDLTDQLVSASTPRKGKKSL
ncbi:MAG TPA: PAS domain S-box protein [Fimbriimonadaceae bacterium]|nr:PAS domain S-box protein [Fimbriimonadaceae bacterium]